MAEKMYLHVSQGKPLTQDERDNVIKKVFKDREQGMDFINKTYQNGDDKNKALETINRIYPESETIKAKSPLELADKISGDGFDENKYNEMIDFIANQRANNISLPDVKEMMDKKYGSNYKDMIEYAFSKWAE